MLVVKRQLGHPAGASPSRPVSSRVTVGEHPTLLASNKHGARWRLSVFGQLRTLVEDATVAGKYRIEVHMIISCAPSPSQDDDVNEVTREGRKKGYGMM